MKKIFRILTIRKRIKNEISEQTNTLEQCQQNRYKHIGSESYMKNIHDQMKAEAVIKALNKLL